MYYLQHEWSCYSGYCTSDKTRMGMLEMARETRLFYGPIGEVILKKNHIYKTRKSKIKRNPYRVYRLLHAHDFTCVFFMNY